MLELTTSVQFIKGIGPRLADVLAAKGIRTVDDLLHYLPFRYEDRSNVKPIRALAPGEMATVLCTVRSTKVAGFQRQNMFVFSPSAPVRKVADAPSILCQFPPRIWRLQRKPNIQTTEDIAT